MAQVRSEPDGKGGFVIWVLCRVPLEMFDDEGWDDHGYAYAVASGYPMY